MEIKELLPLFSNHINGLEKLNIRKDKAGTYLFVLLCIYLEDEDALTIFTDDGQSRTALVVYKDLEFKNLIEKKEDIYHLTMVSKMFIDDVLAKVPKMSLYGDVEERAVARQDNNQVIVEWVDEYLDLWPSKSLQGYFLKGDKKNIHKKLEKFQEEYGFDKEDIFKATRAYLAERKEEDYNFTKKVSNFIFHREVAMGHNVSSDLAAWCEYMKDRAEKPVAVKEEFGAFDDFL